MAASKRFLSLMLARIGSGLLQAALMMLAARQFMQLSLTVTLATLVRPLCGALLMYGVLSTWGPLFSQPVISLVLNVMLGAVFYTSWLFLTWQLVGRPAGLEELILEKLAKLIHMK